MGLWCFFKNSLEYFRLVALYTVNRTEWKKKMSHPIFTEGRVMLKVNTDQIPCHTHTKKTIKLWF